VGGRVTVSEGWFFTIDLVVKRGVDVEVWADVAVDVRLLVLGGIDAVDAGIADWAHADSKPRASNMRDKNARVFLVF
jgi:hypothetical protein